MSAARLGDELLGEVKEEGLDELLRSLRDLVPSCKSGLGLPALDNALDVFQNPPITRQQETQYTQWSTQHRVPPSTKEKAPAVLEIVGATACSGKTQFLSYLIATAVLPPTFDGVALKGRGQAVVLFDLSGKFSILRLRDIMRSYVASRLKESGSTIAEDRTAMLISDSLMHLHVFRPQSTFSLLATLASLPDYLLAQPSSHFSSNLSLGMLAINDLSAFLWQDRLEAEDATSVSTIHPSAPKDSLFLQLYRHLVSHLRHLHDRFSCTIIATNWGLSSRTSIYGQPALRSHQPGAWNAFCTLRIVVERESVTKFGPGMSAEEAKGESEQRWEAVEKSGFVGWVDWSGAEGWREEVREGVKKLERGGRFSFYVTADGFSIDVNGD